MKTLLLIGGILLGPPLVGVLVLFVIGCVVRSENGTPQVQPSSAMRPDTPLANIPLPRVAPDPNGLQSADQDTRQRAASRLGETGKASDCDALLVALTTEKDWSVRAAIITGLGKQYYQSPDVREHGSDRLVLAIIPELKAKQPGLRLNAVRSRLAALDAQYRNCWRRDR